MEEAFNQMVFFVGILIDRPWIADIDLGGNRIDGILRIDIFSDCLGTIALIAKDIAPLDINLAEPWNSVLGIMLIAGASRKTSGLPELSISILFELHLAWHCDGFTAIIA